MSDTYLHGIQTQEHSGGSRAVQTTNASTIGLIGTAPDADASAFPLNEPVLVINNRSEVEKLGAAGTLGDACDAILTQAGAWIVIVRVEEGADISATLSNVAGDVSAQTGVWAFLKAQSEVKVTPRILVAPGFTSQRPSDNKNPVAAQLEALAPRLRAIVFVDGPGTTDVEAVAYRNDFSGQRIMVIDPGVRVWSSEESAYVNQPASAWVAGVQVATDASLGFWHSVSNKPIKGIGGSTRPISFGLSDENCQANFLNGNEVTTIVYQNGYRLWGQRGTSPDPKWAFLQVRRVADLVYDSLEEAHLWAMDRPLTKRLLEDIVETVNGYLRGLKTAGAILGGEAWLDPNINTKESFEAGKLYVDFDIEPAAGLERLTFRAFRNNGYYEELISSQDNA